MFETHTYELRRERRCRFVLIIRWVKILELKDIWIAACNSARLRLDAQQGE